VSEYPVVLVAGSATGEVLCLDEPLSFWGGVDVRTGEIVDRHHPQRGCTVAGRVLAMPSGRGSSSSSSLLLEAVRSGSAPVALLFLRADEILSLGAIVADELYGRSLPVVVLDKDAYSSLMTGETVAVGEDGSLNRHTGSVDGGPDDTTGG
jgi:predicted aconitase with swiveling domain|tara:strand:+ start:6487 stop:6939 length:453 start_codon:yes stop_codon:yes gene_type:complete